MNNYKIINTGNYLLIVDDSEIKEGDWCYHLEMNDGKIDKCKEITLYHTWTDNGVDKKRKFKKVVAHLPLNNSPILEGVDLLPDLPLLEDDIYDTNIQVVGSDKVTTIKEFLKKHNKEVREYTEEDLKKAIKLARGIKEGKDTFTAEDIAGCTEVCTHNWKYEFSDEEIIQSLQQPKIPVGFKCEIQHYYHSSKEFYHDASFVQCTKEQYDSIKKEIPSCFLKKEIKTTTNSQGLTQWVGEYSFDDKK